MIGRIGLHALRTFRAALYRSLGRRRDALFEMIDTASCVALSIACRTSASLLCISGDMAVCTPRSARVS
jgi:hypothetical protein